MSEESGSDKATQACLFFIYGATSKYNDDGQIDDFLQSIQKIRDEILRKESILQERSAQCDMDIQTLLSEGKMTPKAVSIIRKYKETCSDMTKVTNSSCSGDGGQSITKRKKLKVALLRQCKELDEICRGAHWILPRYTVLPSVSDGMYHASVRLRCPDFEMSLTGGLHPTPHEAKCSAAANMILELHKKAEEQEQEVALAILLWDPHRRVPRGHRGPRVLDIGNGFMASGGVFDEAATAIRDVSRAWR
ncbi:hypothetical protein TRIUR3_29158 [Triticum urartu]|uniref:DRBM domain-containing protein n=1 Tax=Triticum urartu TaxID=4572 RepID=M7Z7B2_TRIUA|nr:hypothetical protein TRIUR3_29158 [Triticum urartu]